MTDPMGATPQDNAHRFPVSVDVPVPPEGLGSRLDDMCDWCRDQFGDDEWSQHAATISWPPSAPGVDVARFSFVTEDQAELFERRWCR